jgi:predicted dienelactone hydrolase
MTGQRKLREVNGAVRMNIPDADAQGIGSSERTMPAATRAKAAMLPEPEKTGRALPEATHAEFQRRCCTH